MNTPDHPHEDRLLFVRELARIVGRNEKALRADLRMGLKHIRVGTGRKPILKSCLRWWQEYIESREESAVVARRAQDIIASASAPRNRNLSTASEKVKSGTN